MLIKTALILGPVVSTNQSGSEWSGFGNPMFCYSGSANPSYFCAVNFLQINHGLDHNDPDINLSEWPNLHNQCFKWDYISQCIQSANKPIAVGAAKETWHRDLWDYTLK